MDLKESPASGLVDPASHWYYKTKRIPVRRFFRSASVRLSVPLDVVDIGAGSGVFSDDLAQCFGREIRNIVKVDAHYATDTAVGDVRLGGGIMRKQRSIPAKIENAVVLLMDVLEHVEDDHGLLRSVVASSKGTNYFFVTVPAFQFLWSGHDEFLGHYRRYTLSSLKALAAAAGLSVSDGYYMFGTVLPLVWMARRLGSRHEQRSHLRPCHPVVNQVLSLAGRVDGAWSRWNHLAGVTAVVEGFSDRIAEQTGSRTPARSLAD